MAIALLVAQQPQPKRQYSYQPTRGKIAGGTNADDTVTVGRRFAAEVGVARRATVGGGVAKTSDRTLTII